MVIAYSVIWDSMVESVLKQIKDNIELMDVMGVLKFSGNIFILRNSMLEPERIVIIDLNSPFDVIMPKLLKRLAFRMKLKKMKYGYKPKYIPNKKLLSILLNDPYKINKV